MSLHSDEYGITGYGAYVPRLRIARGAIAAAHQWMAAGLRGHSAGERAHCSWDEDSVTMAVEAGRDALAAHSERIDGRLRGLTLLTATPPASELQCGALAAELLGLPAAVRTLDIASSNRALGAVLDQALCGRVDEGSPALLIASDRPYARPASTQEILQGAGAAAFTLGTNRVIATRLGSASRHALFVDHFRAAGAPADYWWEERWIRDEGYLKLLVGTVIDALNDAGVSAAAVNHFILPTPFKGAAAAVIKKLGVRPEAEVDGLQQHCGFTGPAHGALMLAAALARAKPGEVIVLAGFGQGADALVLRATDAIGEATPPRGAAKALANGLVHDAYLRFATFERNLEPDWGMRGERNLKTAHTEQYRSAWQLGGFVAGRCPACGTVQFPQLAYCLTPGCNAPRAHFKPHPLVDEPAHVLTYTADWATFHLAPPMYVGFLQFHSGARVLMEMVDVAPHGLDVGLPMQVVCRIKDIDRTRGYPRYFWKATPNTGDA